MEKKKWKIIDLFADFRISNAKRSIIKSMDKTTKKFVVGLAFTDLFKPLGDLLYDFENLQSLKLNFPDYLTSYDGVNVLNQPFGDAFKNLKRLRYLSLNNLKTPLGRSLDYLTNLRHLVLHTDYNDNNLVNFDIGDSLNNLKKLKILEIKGMYNDPNIYRNSLSALDNLEELRLPYDYDPDGTINFKQNCRIVKNFNECKQPDPITLENLPEDGKTENNYYRFLDDRDNQGKTTCIRVQDWDQMLANNQRFNPNTRTQSYCFGGDP